MNLARTLERLGTYQKAAACAEEVKAVIRARFPEALFDPLRPVINGNAWVLGVYTSDSEGWRVLATVENNLHNLLVQRQVAIEVVPLPLHHYLDEDIVY